MISQLQWIIASAVAIYAIAGAWTFGYVKAKRGTDSFDATICAVFFPICLICAWALAPIAEMGRDYASACQEKKEKAEAQAKKIRSELELAEQELDEELNNKVA